MIVGQNHNGAARVAASLAADVVGGVEHGAGDIGSAIKALLAKQTVEFALHVLRIAVKRQPHARIAIEDHDAHAVVFAEHGQGLAGCIRDALHVRPHTGADIQQKEHVHRHIFAGEIANGNHLAILAEDEVAGMQVSDGAIAGIDYLGIDANQRHIAAENQVVVIAGCCRGNQGTEANSGR